MKVRFQADNDLDQRIVTATRSLGPAIDFQTAPALNLHGLSDPAVLALTAKQGRVLVSHDKQSAGSLQGLFSGTELSRSDLGFQETLNRKGC